MIMSQIKVKTETNVTNELNKELATKVSAQNVRRTLKAAGFKAKRKMKKPMLTARHKVHRPRWVERHLEWTVEDWSRVIFSDETKLNRICSDGVLYGWTRSQNELPASLVDPILKFGGGSIMVWSCMTMNGVGPLIKVERRMDTAQYIQILVQGLLLTIDATQLLPGFPTPDQLVFQHDNDPKHTSRATKLWLQQQQFKVFEWPANSPGANSIKLLWRKLKTQLGHYETPLKGVHELWERAQLEWRTITPETCKNRYSRLPEVVRPIKRARGGYTG